MINTIGALRNSFNANFEFTVDTTKAGTASDKFQLPLVDVGAVSFIVAWGDGTTDTITNYNDTETLHTYSSSGVYTISIEGEVKGLSFDNLGDKLKITNVSNCGGLNLTEHSIFRGCSNLIWTATDTPVVSTTSLKDMFRDCTLFNSNIGGWDVSLVTEFSSTFRGCTAFDQDLSAWDIGSATNMTNIMAFVTLSTANYDALLIGWESQAPNTGLTPNFWDSTYTAGGAAATARASLVSTYGWTITDGGTA